MQKEWNQTFALLQTIGIIFVVVGHKGGISIFDEWFPIYSFHMPMFIFISGYFWKKHENLQEVGKYILHKLFRLLIAYFLWNLVYGIIVNFFKQIGLVSYTYGANINFKSLFIEPFISGHQYGMNCPGWFVPALFMIEIIYTLFQYFLLNIKLRNLWLTIILLGFNGGGVLLAYNNHRYDCLFFQHWLFGLIFYHVGYIYKLYFEKRDNLNTLIYFGIIFIIQYFNIFMTKNNLFIGMWDANYNNFQGNIVTPLIGAMCGIFFWLRISKILIKSVKDNKMINFISRNTWTIMMHHQFCFFIINLLFYLTKKNIGLFTTFDNDAFSTNPWYAYAPFGYNSFLLAYVLVGISIPLFIKWMLYKIRINNKFIRYLISIV